MAILGEIRKRSWLMVGVIAVALLAFLVTPENYDRVFGKNPNILGKVNGDEITRDEYNDQLFFLQQQAQQQGRPTAGLEEQAWQMTVQNKLIKQQFDKLGLEITDDYFWSQLQYDPMFAQNPQFFDEKGNFKLQEVKREYEGLEASGNIREYNQWLKIRKSIEYRMMARQLVNNISNGVTISKKEVQEMLKQRDQSAEIDYVAVDYEDYLKKNPIKVSTEDLANYIKARPNTFKTENSRNIGLVYFPATASEADEAKVLAEVNKLYAQGTDMSGGTENFQNTTNDSMFVMLNSDMPFSPAYLKKEQMPVGISDKIASASIGQTFGPYKEQGYYVVSKLLDKKASDSVLSKHILIAYDGAMRATTKRTKEAAKKKADSLLAIIQNNPAAFAQGLTLSDEPGAVERNGSVGWVTPDAQFDPAYLNYIMKNPKGTTGVVESSFGYHIINIEDKKSGAMGYKVAHLVKVIKPSEATENEVDKNARRFIQQVQGKSFNDFSNIAKKGNYQFTNPKTVKRFDGMLQGLGTDKDEEIISWAFNKKTEKGDTQFFVVDGTGDRIVAYLNGKQEEGLADPESLRGELEPVVKNQLAAKLIIEKINSAKATSLDQVAKLFSSTKQSAQVNMVAPMLGMSMEPKVAGAAFGIAKGKTSQPIEGMSGVYVVLKKSEKIEKQPGDSEQIQKAMKSQNAQMFGQRLFQSLYDNADIKDYRIEVWDKVAQ